MANVRFLMKRMLPISGILLLAAALLALERPPAEAQQPPGPIHESEQVVGASPVRPQSSVALSNGALRSAVERLQRGETTALGVDLVDSKIRVEVLHSLDSSEIRSVIATLGGTVEGEIEGVLVQALVPFDRLEALESHEGVQSIRPPLEANVPILPPPSDGPASPQYAAEIVGEEVVKTNADDWHAGGYTGAGVKVGIIDFFDGTLWNNAVAAGELPTAAGTFCRDSGASCNIWTIAAGSQHGQAVAEVVHEMAPGAQLYLATVNTVTDLQSAVDYFVGQGVDVISRSLTAQYDGPGNGTGPIATVINNAVANGIVWFNSAGNTAGGGGYYGAYWRGAWANSDGDDWLDFTPGDELMGFACWYLNGVRWSDFGAINPTDYDVCVFDNVGDATPIDCSIGDQTAGAPPLELDLPCNSGGTGVDYLAIALYDAGNGTAGDVLEFMTNGAPVEYWQNPYSATGPASDTASPGALSIGAVDPALGTATGWYSSRGPTNDALYGGTARIKPDISAASCVASFTYSPDCFNGTSASTPAAAGAAALIIGAGVATTPAQVKTYLMSNAVVDRGPAGPDNDFGVGELVLPAPPCPGADPDGDGFGETCDNCPGVANALQTNTDGHDDGDACDPDDDDDGYNDSDEDVPGGNPDPLVAGETPEVCDGGDDDGDTLVDEGFPDNPPGLPRDCMDNTKDDDSDGIGNGADTNDDNSPNADPFSDALENYLGTNRGVMCTVGSNDNDPFDNDLNTAADVSDVLAYVARNSLNTAIIFDDDNYWRRGDLTDDRAVDVSDVLAYVGYNVLNLWCPYGL